MKNPAAITALVAEIDHYLARFDSPGIDDVRDGIARFGEGPVKESIKASAPSCGFLEAALLCVEGANPLRQAIRDALTDLAWVTYGSYPREMIGERFPLAHAFVSLIGGTGFIPADDFELGLFLIAPNTLYRDHRHKAPELYVPLTGPHEWRFGVNEGWTEFQAHTPIWNEPMRVHATLVRKVPFLSLFAWTRDVSAESTVIPASDWAEIEASF